MEHSISRVWMFLSCYINGSLNVTCTNTSLTGLATWDYKPTAVILKPRPPFHRLQHVCLNYLGRKLLLFVFLYHFYYFVALCPTSVILISACMLKGLHEYPPHFTHSIKGSDDAGHPDDSLARESIFSQPVSYRSKFGVRTIASHKSTAVDVICVVSCWSYNYV